MIVNWNEHKNSKRSIPLEDNFTGDSLVWTHNTYNRGAYNPEGILLGTYTGFYCIRFHSSNFFKVCYLFSPVFRYDSASRLASLIIGHILTDSNSLSFDWV